MIHEPTMPPAGRAFLLHGSFSSDKVGPARLYVEIARLLADAGYVVARFDCHGVGDSDGDLEDVSLASQLDDHQALLDSLASAGQEVCLFSHSGSAQLAISLAHSWPGPMSLILLTPTVGATIRFDRLFTDAQQRVLADGGKVVRQGIPISAAYMHNLQDETVFKLAEELKVRRSRLRAAVLYSPSDEYVTTEGALRLSRSLDIEPIAIRDADHNFRLPEARHTLLEEVRRLLGRWSTDSEAPAPAIA